MCAAKNSTLKRTLTLPLLTLYGLGVTVGAGIYVLVGETADLAGTLAPFAFVLAAVVVGFTAYSYAELSTRFPVSAGEAAYVEAGLRQTWLARLIGLAVALSGIVSASAVAIGAGAYLSDLTGWPGEVLTVATVLLMGLIAWWGITESVTLAAVITVIEILGLALVILWGFWIAEPRGVGLAEMIPDPTGIPWAGVGAASVLAFFAFVGFEDMVNVAEEVREPRRTMPIAITVTLVVATMLYIAVAAAVLVALPLSELAGAEAPLTLMFQDAAEAVQAAFSAIAVVATVNGVLIQMVMASRVLYGMASRGHLPKALGQVSRLTRTPTLATALVTALILLLSGVLPIAALASGTSQVVLIVFVFVNLSLIALKLRGSEIEDAFKVPLVVPIIGTVTSAGLLTVSLT